MTTKPDTEPAAYGYAHNDSGRRILVHVVSPEGWTTRFVPGHPDSLWPEHREDQTITSALAMCGTGLNQYADYPGEGQKWCRRCTSPALRDVLRTRY